MTYDLAGNRLTIADADAGTYTYTYDAIGQVKTKHHSVHGTTTYGYDILGRILEESTTSGTTTYDYVPSGNGIGQLKKVSSSYGMNIEYEYTYNDLGLVTNRSETIGTDEFSFQYEYDQLGRVSRTVYPDGFAIRSAYNTYGYMNRVNKDNGSLIWELKETNGKGQAMSMEYGNGLITEYGYDNDFRTDLIKTYVKTNTSAIRQHLTFNWDHNTGNLQERTDQLKGRSESFTYDNLDRLLSYTVAGQQSYSMTYDNNLDGVIKTKTGIGTYNYNEGSSTHAHSSVELASGDIDWADQYSSISYTSFNKVEQISGGDAAVSFYYGPDRRRKKVDNFEGNKDKLYVGDLYEVEDPDGNSRELHYIPGPSGEAAIYTTESGSNGQMFYIHKDHLGSYQTITDQDGNIATLNGQEQVYNFDPWGRRRNATTWTYDAVPEGFLFTRGFTGHEHLDELTLINMNGRMYDPLTGTFLSPDPYIQSPDFTQNYNRYGYAFGNPLKYTDPTGEKFKWWHIAVLGVFGMNSLSAVVNLSKKDHVTGGDVAAAVGQYIVDGLIFIATAGTGSAYKGFEKAAHLIVSNVFFTANKTRCKHCSVRRRFLRWFSERRITGTSFRNLYDWIFYTR
jgi:RHS repeat-associated protein